MPRPDGARNAPGSMTLIDRYFFRQLLRPILAATAGLAAVALLSQSLSALDIIVERGQSPWVLAKLTMLALPQLLSMILPIAVFVGALLALNRLHTEHEVVVCYAGGLSRWRVVAPAVRLAALITLLALALNLFVQPAAQRTMREQVFEVRNDLASTLVKEGEFTRASPELTVYAQRIDQNGLLKDLFIHLERPDGATVYDAQEGRVGKRDGRPVLILRNGSSQEFSSSGVLNFLSFDAYVFDLSPFLTDEARLHYKGSDRWLHELFFPNLESEWERDNRDKLLAEGHSRLASPLYNLAVMALALTGVLGGSFSRTGYGRRIAIVAAVAAVTRILGFAVQAAAAGEPWLNVLQYAVPVTVAVVAFRTLFRQKVRRYVPRACDEQELFAAGAAR